VAAIVGSREGLMEDFYRKGMKLIYPVTPGPMTLEEAMVNARDFVPEAAVQVGLTLEQCHF
jgi:glycerate kinase